MQNPIYERAKANRFKLKYLSFEEKAKITQSNLVQLFIWIDESKITCKSCLFRIADNDKYVVYEHFVYNHYTGELLTAIDAVGEFYKLSYEQAAYLVNYFYYKVSKGDMEDYIKRNYKQQSTTVITNGEVDLNYIINEDGFVGSNSHYCYTRALAYLYNNRKIDKDIVLNFIKQGFLKMDNRNNLCFITYKDALSKDNVIAITRKSTYKEDYKNNLLKEHYTGFFYAKKDLLEIKDFKAVYVFESCVDLMSFLTLIKYEQVLLPEDENSCFISLNGVGNKKYLQKILSQYPSIEKIVFCLDNDKAGINGIERIKQDYVMCQIGTPPDIETIYRYDFCDLRMMLKDITGKFGYCKDWNDVLTHNQSFCYHVTDYDL